jgi:peptidoglycan/xylan/chitin deacetylase (PgdA/CDA1 family)
VKLRDLIRRGRLAVHGASQAAGITRWVGNTRWRKNRLLILCYHGVSLADEHEWHTELFVTAAFLRRRLQLVREFGCQVLPLGEAVKRLAGNSLPSKAVVLTFDDGFHNFHASATPILEAAAMPATVYLSTYYCVHQRPMLSLSIRYLLWKARSNSHPPAILLGLPISGSLQSADYRQGLAASLLEAAHALAPDRLAQMQWLEGLAIELGVPWREFLDSRVLNLMTPDEVSAVSRRGMDVQLHTHRHRTPRDDTLFVGEIEQNRQLISEMTGTRATHFCYPSGDWDQRFLPLLRSRDVVSATTCVAGLAQSSDNPLLLSRFIDTQHQPECVFENWLAGSASLL